MPRWLSALLAYIAASYVICAFAFLRGGAPHGNDGIFVFVWFFSPVMPLMFLGTIASAGAKHFEEWGWLVASFLASWLGLYLLLRLPMWKNEERAKRLYVTAGKGIE
ncbi:hypothetical protein FN976_18540 [Caenimonas sedimenti]|uniref:Uncharacterized protein n=1 Tax=Caenimonas sedimenti TaxID=2596921 RepID=A0A562ZN81_9BURK|nr:hypothetical protein [Caenimonas sedimenti]TWO69816.1 hypothetical protein FN976_18540 [Caenimonas sedimenti]